MSQHKEFVKFKSPRNGKVHIEACSKCGTPKNTKHLSCGGPNKMIQSGWSKV